MCGQVELQVSEGRSFWKYQYKLKFFIIASLLIKLYWSFLIILSLIPFTFWDVFRFLFHIFIYQIGRWFLYFSGTLVVSSADLLGGWTIDRCWIPPPDCVASCWPLVLVDSGWMSGGPQLLSSCTSSRSKLWRSLSFHHRGINPLLWGIVHNFSKESGIIEWNSLIHL